MMPQGAGRWSTVDELALAARQAVRPFSARSCLSVLYWACVVSPQYLPSLAFLLGQTLVGEASGDRIAASADLDAWLASIKRRVPVVEQVQSMTPLDAELLVHVYWDGRMWPLHPGLTEDPELVVERLRRYAEVADGVLVPLLGYGIAEVVTIGLRAMTIQRAFGSERSGDRQRPESADVALRRAADRIEFLLTMDGDGLPVWLVSPWGKPANDRLRAAVVACTRNAGDVAGSEWLLGDALLVRAFEAVLPVPASLVLEAIEAIGVELLARAGKASPEVAERLRTLAEDEFATSARGLATHMVGPIVCGRSGRLSCVMYPAARRLIAVQVAVGTSTRETAREVDRARRRLAEVKAGRVLKVDVPDPEAVPRLGGVDSPLLDGTQAATAVIARDTAIQRVVIVDGPWVRPDKIRAGTILVHVDEWRSIAQKAVADSEEFWAFLDELVDLPRLRMIEQATIYDLWERFASQGFLFAGGPEPERVAGSDPGLRWRRRAEADPYELVLRQVRLPGLRDWPFMSEVQNGCLTVGSTTPYKHAVVSIVPALVFAVDANNPGERTWTHLLGDAILTGLGQMSEAAPGDLAAGWAAWLHAVPDPIRLEFRIFRPASGELVKLLATDGTTFVIGCVPPSDITATPAQVHDELGDLLWCLLIASSTTRTQPATGVQTVNADAATGDIAHDGETFRRAWALLPTTTMFVRTPPSRHVTPKNIAASLTDGARERAQRRISDRAVTIVSADTPLNTPDEVMDNGLIPAARQLLREEVARFDTASAIRTAAVAIERLWAERTRTDDDRALRRATGQPSGDTIDDLTRSNIVTATAADLIAETIVASAPNAGVRMDHRDWHALLNIAAVLDHLIGRRNQDRTGLSTDGQTDPTGRDLPFDAESYSTAIHHANEIKRGRLLLRDELEDPQPASPEDETWPYISWTSTIRGLIAASRKQPMRRTAYEKALIANDALIAAYGTGCDEVFAVLAVASDSTAPEEIAEIAIPDLLARIHVWSGLPEAAIRKAITMLTLTSSDVLQGNDNGRRALGTRLGGRPLLATPDQPDTVLVMPRRVERAANLLLGYLHAAQLPWSDAPDQVVRAFREWEQKSQRAFEGDIEHAAKSPGRIVIPRLKPERAAQLGVTIRGEIDLITIDAQRRRVFVIEAKDGHIPADVEHVFHDILDYYGVPTDSDHPRWANFPDQGNSKPYVQVLIAKTDAIRQCLPNLLNAYGLSADDTGWTVIPMFATPTPVPAAYVPSPLVSFVTIDDLARVIAADDLPENGPPTSLATRRDWRAKSI
jgi:hypothetical protein